MKTSLKGKSTFNDVPIEKYVSKIILRQSYTHQNKAYSSEESEIR